MEIHWKRPARRKHRRVRREFVWRREAGAAAPARRFEDRLVWSAR